MSHALTQFGQDPRYERFLFAPVGEDRRGASATVLSMFARLGVEPWAEAAGLAKLPERAARQRLETLIEHFHDMSTRVADRGPTVSGLLTFLPTQAKSVRSSSDGASAGLAIPPQGSPFYWVIAATLFVGCVAMLAQG